MFIKTTLATVVVATLSSTPLFAETDPEQAIIVTATRTAQTVDQSLASVTVINQQQIEKSQAHTLEELLKNSAGITFSNNGGLGKQTSLFLRGTDDSHTLIMVDGVRMGSATTGSTALQFISLSQIEKIEIVRGPQSSLYGSDAIGGIVHIFTRQGSEGHHVQSSAGIGRYNTREYSLSFSGKEEGFHYSTAVSRLSSDGFDALQDSEIDRDGYDNDAFSIQFGKEFSNNASLSAYLQQSSGFTEFDGGYTNQTQFKQGSQGIKAKMMPNEYWDMSLQIANSIDENTNLHNGDDRGYINTKRQTASWQNDHSIGDNALLTLGIDHQSERVASSTNYAVKEHSYSGIFSQYQAHLKNAQLSIGLREDNHSDFGKQHTGQINLGLNLNQSSRVTVNYGSAYKAPSFNDLYWPFVGNPDLESEQSRAIEIGLKNNKSWGDWHVHAYRTKVDNLIAWREVAPFIWQPMNVDKALIKGLEMQITTHVAGFNISGNANFIEPVNKTTNTLLPRRGKRSASISIAKQLGKLSTAIDINGYSKRYDDVANTTKLGGYGLVDVRVEAALNQNLSIKAKISNLLDKKYQTADGYNTAERALFISIAFKN